VKRSYSVNAYRRVINRGCDLAFLHPVLPKIRKKDLTAAHWAQLPA
jgi:hypothetical protein